MKKTWWDYVAPLVKPNYWLMTTQFSGRWDKRLLALMNDEKFRDFTGYRASIGEYELWVENHPYASFVPQGMFPEVRPSRSTIHFAMRRLHDDLLLGKFDGDPFPEENPEVAELRKMYEGSK